MAMELVIEGKAASFFPHFLAYFIMEQRKVRLIYLVYKKKIQHKKKYYLVKLKKAPQLSEMKKLARAVRKILHSTGRKNC